MSASSGFSENKGLEGGLGRSYLRIFYYMGALHLGRLTIQN